MLEGILTGLEVAARPVNLLLVSAGCFAGTIIGMLPGLGPVSAIALLVPVTYAFDPASALILLAGVYYGAVFGGSTSAILLNAPGVAGTVATTFDGYPLARKGMPGKALAVAAYASFAGGTIAAILLLLAAPALAVISLSFQSPEYFALMVLGLVSVTAFAGEDNAAKAGFMAVLGLMLATVGTDGTDGVMRFTYGRLDLLDGISFLLLAMAAFALSEVLLTILTGDSVSGDGRRSSLGSLRLKPKEVKDIAPAVGRSSLLGFFVGVLPGAGATIASFMGYSMERSVASEQARKEFGKGSLRGLAAPESANNAASSGSFVPLLTLGVPGSGTTAVMLGALISYGVNPGPTLFVERPDVFWGVIVSMYIGNVVLLILNLPLIPYISRVLALPSNVLAPLIIFFCLAGVYLVSFNTFDLFMMIGIGAIAVVLRLFRYPMAPMIVGFTLGGLLETNLRRSLVLYDDSLTFLWERPLTLIILSLTVLIAAIPLLRRAWRRAVVD
ncbi:MAG: tripartite tricarboxylate transporter permease [Xanthomonadales bacterium]|nr:tripartite tricarboxylate transporter permease [Xanthomonadales bacterium]